VWRTWWLVHDCLVMTSISEGFHPRQVKEALKLRFAGIVSVKIWRRSQYASKAYPICTVAETTCPRVMAVSVVDAFAGDRTNPSVPFLDNQTYAMNPSGRRGPFYEQARSKQTISLLKTLILNCLHPQWIGKFNFRTLKQRRGCDRSYLYHAPFALVPWKRACVTWKPSFTTL